MQPSTSSYIIRGGLSGRERLRVIARVMRPTTLALLDRVGVPEGARCLDAGCGGGDVTLELAARAGPTGRVLGVDFDEEKLATARAEAVAAGSSVEYRRADVATDDLGPGSTSCTRASSSRTCAIRRALAIGSAARSGPAAR